MSCSCLGAHLGGAREGILSSCVQLGCRSWDGPIARWDHACLCSKSWLCSTGRVPLWSSRLSNNTFLYHRQQQQQQEGIGHQHVETCVPLF